MKKLVTEGNNLHAHTAIFLHIPKTAGVTIRHLIRRQYQETEMFHGNLLLEKDIIEAMGSLSVEQKYQIRMLWGHLIFGVHNHLPESSAYFTFLRDPIERTISHYYYVLSRPEEFEIAKYIAEENIGFHEALERELIRDIQNVQTRMIAGLPYDFPPNTYTEEHLEIAKHNLSNHFAVVGLVERFDESLLLLKRAFGWGNIYYNRQNKTPSRPYQGEIPPETMALIEKENSLDIKLYKFAQQLFAKQLAQQDDHFVKALNQFKFWNQTFYDPLKTKYDIANGFVKKAYWQMRKVSVREMIKQQFNK